MKLIYHCPRQFLYVDFFVNPLPAAAMMTMALNDHWWKRAFPSWLTGKISDFMGVFYFPLFLCAFVCLVRNFVLRPAARSERMAYITPHLMFACMVFTAIVMAAIKLSPQNALGVQTLFSRYLFAIRLVADPTDLISLLSLPASYVYARRFFGRGPQARA